MELLHLDRVGGKSSPCLLLFFLDEKEWVFFDLGSQISCGASSIWSREESSRPSGQGLGV